MPAPNEPDIAVEFAINPEPRCPRALLLDASGSMDGAPIQALNEGLRAFQQDAAKDSLASRRLEIAVVAFNDEVTVLQDFVTVDQFTPPTLAAGGTTHMGSAILRALDLVQAKKAQYKASGVSFYRPWVFMITDGEPQGEPDDVAERAARRLAEDEERKRVAFFAVGVEGANMEKLKRLSPRPPVKLMGLNFVEMFVWLSRSTQAVTHSGVDDMVALPPPG